MDTIIFGVLLVAAFFAARGAAGKIVIPLFVIGLVLSAVLFQHHVTSSLNLEF